MAKKSITKTEKQLLLENEELRTRLAEAEETLNAIRNGEVDAIVVPGTDGEKVFSLTSAETPYRLIIEEMNEGAVVLSADGIILYCNRRFAELVSASLEQIAGSTFIRFVAESDKPKYDVLLHAGLKERRSGEITCLIHASNPVYFYLSFSPLPPHMLGDVCIMTTDITELKQKEEELRHARNTLEQQVTERTATLNKTVEELAASQLATMNMMEDALEAKNALGIANKELLVQITERKQAEKALRKAHAELELRVQKRTAELKKANRALRTIIECNQALVRITEEQPLLNEICKIIITIGGYRMVWVGLAEQDEEKTVRPVAKAGFEEGYLDTLNITWADTERGRGPTGTAIRTGKYSICKDMLTNPNFVLWRAEASKRGYASSLALPLIDKGQTFGALNIYAAEPEAFDDEEVKLLTDLANNLAFGIMSLRSLKERKQMEERLNYLAYYDALTGIPNRNLFVDRLNQAIARARHIKKFSAVLSVDIDRFKLINNTLGFDAGNAVLKEVAERLKISIRDGDTVARLGSDDFGILLNDVVHSEDVILVVKKVMKNVSQPINFKGKEIVLTLDVGVAVYPNDGNDSYTLMKNADLALSKAKQQGSKNYQFFTEDMDVKASEFVQMEQRLFNALQNEEYILHYQPYWDINTKKIMGMEALIRWQSKDMGLVSPGKFIPVLEETGMILEVGEWILKTAAGQVKEWQNKGYPVVPVSVNLSLIQFTQKELAEMVKRIIAEVGFDPSLLTLEVTESAFMHNIEFTSSVIKELKDIGVSISIDDFGTGYSSLSYLKRFPIDNLKIDISFIREIDLDPDTASIITAIISMAHTLNLKTIAEGVETEEQWKILRLLRCDIGQGYYHSKPLTADEAKKLLSGN